MFVGVSESVADAETFSVVSSLITWFAGTVRTGAVLISFTVTVNDFVSLRFGEPLSVTLTVMEFVLGPCVSVGVHEIAPVFGLIVIPVGGETRLKVSVLVGTSESVAEAATFSVASSLIT